MVYLDHRFLQPVGGFRFYPGHIRVKILDPIETREMTYEQAEQLKARVYGLMESVLLCEDKHLAGSKPTNAA